MVLVSPDDEFIGSSRMLALAVEAISSRVLYIYYV
jgi:hypothetical protein